MKNIFYNTFFAMGTRFDIVIPDVETSLGEKIYSDIQKEVLRLENKLSFFHSQSDVSIINQEAGKKPITIDKETFQVIETSIKYHRLTGGSFDICKAALKHQDEYQPREGVDAIELDPVNSTIFFKVKDLKIDLGGMGKGLALERVKHMLLNTGIEHALVSFGESSILALGQHPKGNCWKIGMRSRVNTDTFVHQFELSNMSLSTSGDFYFNDNGEISHNSHIIDPETNQLISKNQLVSVVSESPLDAEIASTALYVKNKEEARSIIQNFENINCAFFNFINNKETFEIYEQ